MQGLSLQASKALAAVICLLGVSAAAQEAASPTSVVISVAEQKLAILRDGDLLKKYPISTSKFGIGDSYGSYKTPLGKLKVCDKIGDDLTAGAVLKQRHATGEVLPVNAPGRDPIVTRILWLEGLESQNENAKGRGIYIHGTVEEKKIGAPVSYGCIRMRSRDVVEVYDEVPLEAEVTIIAEKLPRYRKYSPPKPPMIAAAPAAKPAETAPAASKGARKSTSPTPTLTLAAQTSAPIGLEKSPKSEPARDSTAHLALQGSILHAGLPQGPKIPTPPAPAEAQEAPRFGPMTPGLSAESAFSLRGISRDLSTEHPLLIPPAAADSPAAATPAGPDAVSEAARPSPRIAFRAGPSETKPAP